MSFAECTKLNNDVSCNVHMTHLDMFFSDCEMVSERQIMDVVTL